MCRGRGICRVMETRPNGNQALERHGCIVFDLKRNLG